MNINQKGFASVLIIILVVIIIGTVGYFILVRKPATLTIDQSQNIPPQQMANNTQSQTPPTLNEQVNWKTYSNSSLGYSFKYPGDWFLYENDQVVQVAPDIDPRSVDVYPYLHIGKKVDDRDIISIKEARLKTNPTAKESKTLIGGRTAYQFDQPFNILSVSYVKYSNNFLVITTQSSRDINLEYSKNIQKIFSTFKFAK